MNKLKLFFVGIISVLVLSGCVKAEYHITINEDGSTDYSTFIGLAESAMGFASPEEAFGDFKTQFEEEGFDVEPHKQDGYEGYIVTNHFEDLEKFESGIINDSGEEQTFKVTKEEESSKTVYKVEADIQLDDMDSMDNGVELEDDYYSDGEDFENIGFKDEDMEFIDNMIKFQFKVTLPVEPLTHNAQEFDEETNTLTWDVASEEFEGIEFDFELPKSNTGGFDIKYLIGGLLILGGIIGIVMIRRPEKE